MRGLGRTWAALAALGAGLVHLGAASRSPIVALLVLAVLGAAELTWAVAVLARQRAPLPDLALAIAVAAPVAWAVIAAAGRASMLPAEAMTGATLLDLAGAVLLAARRRTGPGSPPGVAIYLIGLAIGGLVVAAVVTASLGAGAPAGAMPGMGM